MRHLYANDWHQCVRCGLTRPDTELETIRREDTTLGIDERVHACRDPVVCARFKQFRDESAARVAEDQHLELAAPIKARGPYQRKRK